MQEAIRLAIEEGGYQPKHKMAGVLWEKTVLDPAFWQALGTALAWHKGITKFGFSVIWKREALRYFELRLTGGSEEAFWKELTKGNIHAGSN